MIIKKSTTVYYLPGDPYVLLQDLYAALKQRYSHIRPVKGMITVKIFIGIEILPGNVLLGVVPYTLLWPTCLHIAQLFDSQLSGKVIEGIDSVYSLEVVQLYVPKPHIKITINEMDVIV